MLWSCHLSRVGDSFNPGRRRLRSMHDGDAGGEGEEMNADGDASG
jgi:hypothetical protein